MFHAASAWETVVIQEKTKNPLWKKHLIACLSGIFEKGVLDFGHDTQLQKNGNVALCLLAATFV